MAKSAARREARTVSYALVGGLLLVAGLLQASSNNSSLVQRFLVRDTYLSNGDSGLKKALDYRLTEYTAIRPTSFFGFGVLLHQAVHEPLACVERYIRKTCGAGYRPKTLSGWRPYNTYREAPDWRHQEFSNHIFGLAIDIDPDLNPCCGCVKEWAKSSRCKEGALRIDPDKPPLGRHDIPACWIDAFKHFGFHWLGDDPGLRDTMHFEYLAKPGEVHCATDRPSGAASEPVAPRVGQ